MEHDPIQEALCAQNTGRPTNIRIYSNEAGDVGGYLECDGFAPGYISHGRPTILYGTDGKEVARSSTGFMSDNNEATHTEFEEQLAKIKAEFPVEKEIECPR